LKYGLTCRYFNLKNPIIGVFCYGIKVFHHDSTRIGTAH
jgi:hypothetical protein